MDNHINLSQLLTDVKITIQEQYESYIWVIAEINEMNHNRNGHCYLELIEKDENSKKIKSKIRATIWAYTYRTIKAYFETVTNQELRSGLKVLLQVSVEYHEVYGISLNVHDIDPNYTLGDIAQQRAKIINQLQDDGVLDMNKDLMLPLVPQRIAIISSETAAGYTDFVSQLQNNAFGYSFKTTLYPAIMQGDNAAQSIIQAFDNIFDNINNYDVVILIRGGGSKSDLSCFDDYDIAYYITQFPIPVLTGIGHERDDTIVDIVAHTKLKTPTAVAEFLISRVNDFSALLDKYNTYLSTITDDLLQTNTLVLSDLLHRIELSTSNLLHKNINTVNNYNALLTNSVLKMYYDKENELDNTTKNLKTILKNKIRAEDDKHLFLNQKLQNRVNNYIDKKSNQINFIQEKIELVNPENILKRGYAIAFYKNRVIKDTSNLELGEQITIKLAKGIIDSIVVKKK